MGWSEKIHARRIFLLRGGKAGSINRSTDALVATMPRRIGQRRTGPNTTTCNRASALRRRRRRANRTKPSRSGSFCKEGAAEGVSPVPGGGSPRPEARVLCHREMFVEREDAQAAASNHPGSSTC
jgi:hypothetical protein